MKCCKNRHNKNVTFKSRCNVSGWSTVVDKDTSNGREIERELTCKVGEREVYNRRHRKKCV